MYDNRAHPSASQVWRRDR